LILLSSAAPSVLNTAHAQTNATATNQTGKTSSTKASQPIIGAITITGMFLNNATQKIAGSKSELN
jgi:hypothetical protein